MDAFFLADTYLLRGAAIGDIDSVQSISEVREFGPGESIVTERDGGQDIMILADGRARVTTREGDLLDELRRGDIVGEVAFLDGGGRTANVTAVGAARVLVIPADRFRELLKASPTLEIVVLRNIALALCQKLRDANQQVEAFLVPH